MAIPKVCGIETEYGILVRGADSNPVTASSLLINAYLAANSRKVGWDFEDEHPGSDARGFSVDDLLAPDIDTHLVNANPAVERALGGEALPAESRIVELSLPGADRLGGPSQDTRAELLIPRRERRSEGGVISEELRAATVRLGAAPLGPDDGKAQHHHKHGGCLLYTSPSPRD